MNNKQVLEIANKHRHEHGGILAILKEIQDKCGYLPENMLREVAAKTGRSLVDLFAVATFYKAFRLKPRGKHLITVCLGTACHVRGAGAVSEELQSLLNIAPGETTRDKDFTLETVNCLGTCALGPMVVIDGKYFSRVNKSMVAGLIEKAIQGLEMKNILGDKRVFPLEVSCPNCHHSLMDPSYLVDQHPSIKINLSFNDKHGWVRLSSLYGSHNLASEYHIPDDAVAHFFCPYCHSELSGIGACPECNANLGALLVQGGGMVWFCSRRGCKGHALQISDSEFPDPALKTRAPKTEPKGVSL